MTAAAENGAVCCCRSTASTTRSSSACRPRYARNPATHGVRRILLTASGGPFHDRPDVDLRARDARRGVRASELVDGTQDLGRLRDDDEQGTRGHRGALAVRRPRVADRGRRPSGRASSIRSSNTSTGRCSRSWSNPDMRTPIAQALAFPDRIDAGVAAARLSRARRADVRARRPARFPCIDLAYAALAADAAAPRGASTPPTRSPWRPSSRRRAFRRHRPGACDTVLARRSVAPVVTLDDALAADAEARALACSALGLPRAARAALAA